MFITLADYAVINTTNKVHDFTENCRLTTYTRCSLRIVVRRLTEFVLRYVIVFVLQLATEARAWHIGTTTVYAIVWHAIWRANEGRTHDSVRVHARRCGSGEAVRVMS